MRSIFISILTFCCLCTTAQNIEKKLIFQFDHDSLLAKEYKFSFNPNGDFLLQLKKGENQYYYISNKDTLGPFSSISSTYSSTGYIDIAYAADKPEKEIYYKSKNGTKLYGPVQGEIERILTKYSSDDVALTIKKTDSFCYYINGRQVGKKFRDKKTYSDIEDWCYFSKNGNSIYYVPADGYESLYINDKLIDTGYRFSTPGITDDGRYNYAKGRAGDPNSKYNFYFLVHTNDTILFPVRTVWNHHLEDNGSYYYSGDDNGPQYIAINDNLYKGIYDISNITLVDKNYLFTFSDVKTQKINVNGKIYALDFSSIYYPTMDSAGNFSFYGLKDYYLYKVINGIKVNKPLSKYGVRATPVYISPTGRSVHFFKTDDSTYIYRDEEMILPAISNAASFRITSAYGDFITKHEYGPYMGGTDDLVVLTIDSVMYWLYKGRISQPIKHALKQSYKSTSAQGEFPIGTLTGNGFFCLQKTGDKNYFLNINNSSYKSIVGMDEILKNKYFFDGKKLIFYGRSGLSFHQFIVTL